MAEVGQVWNMPPIINQYNDDDDDMPALVGGNQDNYQDNYQNNYNMPALVGGNQDNYQDNFNIPALDNNNQDNYDMPILINDNQNNDDDMPALIGGNQENYDDIPALIGGNQVEVYIINYIVPHIPPVFEEKPIYINSDTYDKSDICEIIYNNETIKLIFTSTYSPEYGYDMQLSMDYNNADSHNIVYFSQGALDIFEKYTRVYEKVVFICIGDNKYIISAKLLLNNSDDHGYESINISGTFISCIPGSDLYKLCEKVLYHTQPFYYYV